MENGHKNIKLLRTSKEKPICDHSPAFSTFQQRRGAPISPHGNHRRCGRWIPRSPERYRKQPKLGNTDCLAIYINILENSGCNHRVFHGARSCAKHITNWWECPSIISNRGAELEPWIFCELLTSGIIITGKPSLWLQLGREWMALSHKNGTICRSLCVKNFVEHHHYDQKWSNDIKSTPPRIWSITYVNSGYVWINPSLDPWQSMTVHDSPTSISKPWSCRSHCRWPQAGWQWPWRAVGQEDPVLPAADGEFEEWTRPLHIRDP